MPNAREGLLGLHAVHGSDVDQLREQLRAFDVSEELVSEARPLSRPFDESGNVGHHDLTALVVLDRPERGLERREWIVRDFGRCPRQSAQ